MNPRLQAIVTSAWFNRVMIAVVLLAGLLAGLETDRSMLERYGSVLRALDLLVLVVFVVEITLKIAAHGRRPWDFFRDGWNTFDFLIVAVCCLPMHTQFAAVFRLARGLRLLRLVTAIPKLQLLVGALLKSLGAMGYVSLLLSLVFYIYAVAGTHLFGSMDPKHFGSISSALLSLFRLITLDNWSDLFVPLSAQAQVSSVLYFVSFIMLGTMIMLNLFIGIIMNSMAEMHNEMAERERTGHLAHTGTITVQDELMLIEQQLEELKKQSSRLRQRVAAQPEQNENVSAQ